MSLVAFYRRFHEPILESTSAIPASSSAESYSSRVMGNFSRSRERQQTKLMADPKTFKASPKEAIQSGVRVLHLKFGEGKVISIDGSPGNRVATIYFQGIDNPERRIMLKFAKLQVL